MLLTLAPKNAKVLQHNQPVRQVEEVASRSLLDHAGAALKPPSIFFLASSGVLPVATHPGISLQPLAEGGNITQTV